MRTIGFLHTSPVHIATFDGLLATAGADVRAVHAVDESLLADARVSGADAVRERLAAHLDDVAARGADVVCCTCSTLGGLAEELGAADGGVPVVRVDRPMARRAVEIGERVVVVASVASTIDPSRDVLLDEAVRAGRDVKIMANIVERAWDAFDAGDLDEYAHQVAGACRRVAGDADVVVLAQASMAGAVERLDDLPVPVLASPALAVEWLITSSRGARAGR